MNKIILKLEGLVIFLGCLYFYSTSNFSWWIFILLLLFPDISALGYLKSMKVGTRIYNLFHTYIVSVLPLSYGLLTNNDICLILGIIWTAHIGMDRLLGYGLKYPTHFKDTHISRI